MDAAAPSSPVPSSPASSSPAPASPDAASRSGAAPARRPPIAGLAHHTARAAAGLLLAAMALVTLLAVAPALAARLPGSVFGTIVELFFGTPTTRFMTAAVFDIAAFLGLRSYVGAGRGLAREEKALTQAREATGEGIKILRRRSASQSPFFAAGGEAIPGLSRTATYAMAENIAKDAEAFRYEPIAMIIDRVAPQVLVGSLNLREAQQLGIRLGILGTFLGMTAALGKITAVFGAGSDVDASQAAVGGVISSLSLGFGTSIAGLLAAILIQIMAWGLRDRESAVLAEMQEVAAGMQALYRQAERASSSFGAQMDDLKTTMHELGRDLDRQGGLIAHEGRRLEEATREVAGAFQGPLGEIGRTGERLSALLAAQGGAVAALSQTTSSVAALQENVAGHIERAMGRTNAVQQEAAEALRAEIRALSGAIAAEMRQGFETARAIERAGDLAAQLARAAGQLEAAAGAQRRAAWPATALLAVIAALMAVGLYLNASPLRAIPPPAAANVETPAEAPLAVPPEKGDRP